MRRAGGGRLLFLDVLVPTGGVEKDGRSGVGDGEREVDGAGLVNTYSCDIGSGEERGGGRSHRQRMAVHNNLQGGREKCKQARPR